MALSAHVYKRGLVWEMNIWIFIFSLFSVISCRFPKSIHIINVENRAQLKNTVNYNIR